MRPHSTSASLAAEAETASHELMLETLAQVAPGTQLRDGLERILRGRTGGIVVLGTSKVVETISTGGFPIDVEFSATRLRELAKLDGAVVLDRYASRILAAGVQLIPDPSIPTGETGTRHRTAERTAKQTGFPVISVSQSMQIVQLYVHDQRHVLQHSERLLSHAAQALDTLERYKMRLDEVAETLTYLEVVDRATVADVIAVLQRQEMVRRISGEIREYILELGVDGRLVTLQHEELVGSFAGTQENLLRDYLGEIPGHESIETAMSNLAALDGSDLIDVDRIAHAIGTAASTEALDTTVRPRGFRVLAAMRRIPPVVVDRIVDRFPSFPALLSARTEELLEVEGVGGNRAKMVREGLDHLVAEVTDR
ncbi:DNA integrity scanning diadenylate cyclase DisA [Brevibacterium litoralis]|uniref:DNA integrity scanning diadenylate cyclase DisA n=1 Tax=Brevibacterium litoralis TaxID=3138935 RepID=UPI0032EE4AC5